MERRGRGSRFFSDQYDDLPFFAVRSHPPSVPARFKARLFFSSLLYVFQLSPHWLHVSSTALLLLEL